MRNKIILWTVLTVPYICLVPAFIWYKHVVNTVKSSSFIIISKQNMMLYHYKYNGELLQKSPIACGKNAGDKEGVGDYKTPEGVFRLGEVRDAHSWSHDFKGDSLGEIKGAYGPFFIPIDVPGYKGIGIHGTHDPGSIGTRASEGCIRLPNNQLIALVNHINSATIVVITPAQSDIDSTVKNAERKQPLKPSKKKAR